MSLESAQQFVMTMREDKDLRDHAKKAVVDGGLSDLIRNKGFDFELPHLVAAMAGCMEESEQDR